jgi:hypothetical protein
MKNLFMFICVLLILRSDAVAQQNDSIKTSGVYYNIRNGDFTDSAYLDGQWHILTNTNKRYLHSIFFYENNSVCFGSMELPPGKYDDQGALSTYKIYLAKQLIKPKYNFDWGRYKITGKSVHVIYYTIGAVEFSGMKKREMLLEIDNANHLLEKTVICNWCKNQYKAFKRSDTVEYHPPLNYFFDPTGMKPDSSKGFYKNTHKG